MLALLFNKQVVFNGLAQGLIYGLLGMAVVLVHRSSKVINFAAGNMGLLGAGLFMILCLNWNVPYWLALALGLAAGTVFGAIMELIVVRRLFKAPRIILLVATIGISQVSLAVMTALPDVKDLSATFPQALNRTWHVLGVQIRGPQATALFSVPFIALGLAWFLNRTLIGRCVRASSGNPDLARLSGVNPKILSTLVWALAGFLATVSMTLIAASNGSTVAVRALGTATLLRAIAAGAVGRFKSMQVALGVGVAIGVGEALLSLNITTMPGLTEMLLLVVVLLAIGLQHRERGSGEEAAFAYVPKVAALPERLRAKFWVRNLDRMALSVLLVGAVLLPIIVHGSARHQLYTSMLAYAIAGLSLTVLTGWSGQLSLGQLGFGGIGALFAAALTRGLKVDWVIHGTHLLNFETYGIPFALAIPIAALFTAVLAAVIGAGALRVRGLMLAVTTFAFGIAATSFLYQLDVLSGDFGTRVPWRRGMLWHWNLREPRAFFYAALGALVVLTAMVGRLRRSGVGRVTIAVRDNPVTAAAYTVRPALVKLRSFALSGFLAGFGGAVLAAIGEGFRMGDTRFQAGQSLTLVSLVVIGGLGSTAGAVIGSVWVIGLPALMPNNDLVPLLTSGVGLLLLLLYFPGGLVHIAHRVRGAIYTHLESKLPPVEKSATAVPPTLTRSTRAVVEHEVSLKASDISVVFGGLRANHHVNIEVRRDEIVGLIGTNGSGKTTLMNAVGGYVHSTGRVELLGEDVSHDQAAIRARKGLGRTFQAAMLFPELTVRETVMVALESRGRTGMVETLVFSPRMRARERSKRAEAGELIDFLGLGRYADRPISELSTGTRRIVELAGLLALDARVLCLDEPTAGIAQRETEAMGPLLVEIRRQLGASMLVIEHDMPLIMSISDRVYCLEAGKVIASGTPSEVRNDPAVVASYLGTNQHAIERSGTLSQ
jgi:ABC-type branched-subunit amino acid transport system ATPase component/ABC-type branched-subunit amino acid transport system permease subunit